MRHTHALTHSHVNCEENMTKDRLDGVRRHMQEQGLDGFIVPRADEHLGEYVPPGAERLAWLTGFTGSAGLAVVLANRAAAFTDGRYVLQLAAQTDPALFERLHITDDPAPAWIAANTAKSARIGYDPLLISEDGLGRFTGAGLTMVAADPNPVDAAWLDRPPPPSAPARPHPLRYAGKPAAEKRAEVASVLRGAGQDAAVITDPASLAWLLNIRGGDVDFTPFALGFLLLHADETAALYMDGAKLPTETRAWLGNGVAIEDRSALAPGLDSLAGKTVRVDAAGSPVWFAQRLRAAGATVVDAADPCALPKSCKNSTEQDGARAAHARDAVALCRFLHWLDQVGRTGTVTEMQAAEQLLRFRADTEGFKGESFPAISGAGEHGAIIHYRASAATDRLIQANEAYLIDSGAQFLDGTTDVTRTIWTGPDRAPAELRDRATRVMQGHIAIATAVFPQGVSGPHLDALARGALWRAGLDYDHGTGHGVGSYLSVHEGPASLSRNGRMVPLALGMIISNEPGFYQPGGYGIRLENLLMVQKAEFPAMKKPFLRFEVLTLAPFDRGLLDADAFTRREREWLDGYHARVLAEVGPHLDGEDLAWLQGRCAPLTALV